jgi:hypothetical protein
VCDVEGAEHQGAERREVKGLVRKVKITRDEHGR